MRKFIASLIVVVMMASPGLWAQQAETPASQDTTKQEIEQLKKQLAALEARLAAQEKAAEQKASETKQTTPAAADTVSVTDLQAQVKEIDSRVANAEKKTALDRLQWSGDYRFQAHTINAHIPSHFDGMKMQNLLVRTMFYMNTVGAPPASIDAINANVQSRYSDYQFFTNNLTFKDLKAAMGQFPAAMQQQLFGMLMPSTFVPGYNANNDILYTNRLRLNFDAPVAPNVSVTARLSMYKVFGDSTGVQVFNGQPNTMAIDGTTARVPGSDLLRVERAYFTWKDIGGSPLYLSIGRRPSTEGPPMNFRQDEPRGGTPSGSMIDYQFDGVTVGYHLSEKTSLRACYGLGYESGYGNGDALKLPADRLKDVHLFGGNFDVYSTDKTFIQATIAKAWNVTDGFNGQLVLPNNPVTGEVVPAPVIMRYTPSVNLGDINLYGVNLNRTIGPLDMYSSFNWTSIRPNSETSPFGGLMSDPFETPVNREGHMILLGARFRFPKNDGATKLGFEFNQGSKYWFNFAQAEDDIVAPKTNTRGEAYETYLTHRISQHFIFKADLIRYNYAYSGSGWHVGAPKRLSELPMLGFPTYDNATMFSFGLTARF